jgi:hypothetical protein
MQYVKAVELIGVQPGMNQLLTWKQTLDEETDNTD